MKSEDARALSRKIRCTFATRNPYPVKVFHPILEESLFIDLRSQFPPAEEMPRLGGVGNKRSLSDGKRGGFDRIRGSVPVWKTFHQNVFRSGALLDLAKQHFAILNKAEDIKQRMELSLMPADGGNISPHPDTAKKLVTVVIYLADDDWKQEWGGQFSMVIPQIPTDPTQGYPRIGFDQVKLAHAVPFRPNTAVIMERSEKSFHAVYPLKAPEGRDRRTITINFIGRPV